MKRISLIGRIRYFANIFIVMQGILLALLTVFLLNQKYMDSWENYSTDNPGITIYLNNVSGEKSRELENYFYEKSYEEGLLIVRKDTLLNQDGGFGGFRFGICGDTSHVQAGQLFIGKEVVDHSQIEELLTSENIDSTLGMDTGSIHMTADIPRFRFGAKVVIKQLSQLIQESKTINGTYRVNGLSESEKADDFLEGLQNITGFSEDKLLTPMSGEIRDSGFTRDILMVFFAAAVILNTAAFLVTAVKNLGKQGKLVLLGWSKAAFIYGLFSECFLFAVGCIPVLIITGYFISGWPQISIMLFGFFTLAALVNVLFVGMEMAAASIVVWVARPIDAIHGRIPKRVLYMFGIAGYLLLSGCMIFCGGYIDGPMHYLSENARLARQWEGVEDYEILRGLSVGEDADTFTGRSKQLDQDVFNWYSEIAGKEGVYLIHTSYYDDGVFDLWRKNRIYKAVPEEPFWYFTVSPNYLEKLGIDVPEGLLDAAEQGRRLYLLPEDMPETSQAQLKAWMEESTVMNLGSGDIQTEFTKHPQYEYMTYKPEKELFTWAVEAEHSAVTANPVIYVAVPQNMRYFETESLRANGFDGYIKFLDRQTMEKYTDEDILGRYHLLDNEISFTAVKNYIDGIQKTLWTTISLFGTVFGILLFVLIGLLIILAAIFRIANQKRIYVEKFLGFSFWQIYRGPVLFLSGVVLLEFIVMLMLRSKFGILLLAAASILQIFIFVKYLSRNELQRMLSAFKGD